MAEAVAAANALGKTLRNVSQLLNEPVAQFVGITVDGAELGEVFPTQDEEISFGRINATYTFNDDRVMSKRHARIYRRGENFFLEDLRSLNGTMVMVHLKAPVPLGVSVSIADQGTSAIVSFKPARYDFLIGDPRLPQLAVIGSSVHPCPGGPQFALWALLADLLHHLLGSGLISVGPCTRSTDAPSAKPSPTIRCFSSSDRYCRLVVTGCAKVSIIPACLCHLTLAVENALRREYAADL
jgi:hypothetical protein